MKLALRKMRYSQGIIALEEMSVPITLLRWRCLPLGMAAIITVIPTGIVSDNKRFMFIDFFDLY